MIRFAELIQVIHTVETRGSGEPGDPVRGVSVYWSTDGTRLAENDPHAPLRGRT